MRQLGKRTFQIILTQGYNRQIRRMCEYFDYRVEELKRVRILNVRLGDLEPGAHRRIEGEEYDRLLKLLADSKNGPVIAEKGAGKWT